jgi:hypothetical protein
MGRLAVPRADWITRSSDALWVSSEAGKVFRVDPATLAVRATIPVGANRLASAWINASSGCRTSAPIQSPSSTRVRALRGATLAVGKGPVAVAEAGGDAWVTAGDGDLWRLSTAG